jgi:hypothetical protein
MLSLFDTLEEDLDREDFVCGEDSTGGSGGVCRPLPPPRPAETSLLYWRSLSWYSCRGNKRGRRSS